MDRIIFLSTLSSFYYYPLGIPYSFVLTNLMIIFMYCINKNKINKNNILKILFFNILFLSTFFITKEIPKIRNIFPVIIGSISYCILKSNKINKDRIKKGIKISLKLQILFFYFQFCGYYLFEKKIDFVKFYSGTVARGINTTVFRAGGLFHEPGTYGMIILGLIILWDNYKIKRNYIYFLSLLSLFLCYSAKIIILSLVYIIILEFIKKDKFNNKILIIIIGIILFFKFKFYIIRKIFQNNGELAENFKLINIFKSYDTIRILKGSGYGINDYFVLLENGLLFTFFMQMGVIGIVLYVYIIIILSVSTWKEKIILILFLFTKINLNFAFFWIFLSLFGSGNNEKK